MSSAQNVDSQSAVPPFHIRVSRKKLVSQVAASTKRAINQHVARALEQGSKEKEKKRKDSICASFPSFLTKGGS